MGAPLPLHISISRPLSLSTADKDNFLQDVVSGLRNSGVGPFKVSPRELAWYKSPDSERSFLILRVETCAKNDVTDPNPELMALLNKCNTIATRYNQPPLYQGNRNEPSSNAFHVSVGWTLGHVDDQASSKALETLEQDKWLPIQAWDIQVSGIKAKIGNVVTNVPLNNDRGKRTAEELFY